jgi:hypothetical protein
MSDLVQVAVIVSIGPTVAALAALLVAIRTQAKVETVHELINSRLSKMLANENARGRQDERDSAVAAAAAAAAAAEKA